MATCWVSSPRVRMMRPVRVVGSVKGATVKVTFVPSVAPRVIQLASDFAVKPPSASVIVPVPPAAVKLCSEERTRSVCSVFVAGSSLRQELTPTRSVSEARRSAPSDV